MNVKKLKTLIAYMEGLPVATRRHFAMRWWVGHNGNPSVWEHITDPKEVSKGTLIKCGMAACAMGWAAPSQPSYSKSVGNTREEIYQAAFARIGTGFPMKTTPDSSVIEQPLYKGLVAGLIPARATQ